MLDEPFSHIAPLHIATLQRLIRQETAHKGILLTDHLYRPVIDLADRLYVMANSQTYLTHTDDDLVKYGYLRQTE